MSEFILVPDNFVKYVTEFRRIPIPVDTDLDTVRALIETLCLEVSLGADQRAAADPRAPQRDGALTDP